MSQMKEMQRRSRKNSGKNGAGYVDKRPAEDLVTLRQMETMFRLAGCAFVHEVGDFSVFKNGCPVTIIVEGGNGTEEISLKGPRALAQNPFHTPFVKREDVHGFIQNAGGNLAALKL